MAIALPTMLFVAIALTTTMSTANAIDIMDKDLASEESLWALYERWCENHVVEREIDDKARRFNVFKENARMIHEFNQHDMPYKLSLNLFGDMTDEEVNHTYGRCSNIMSSGRKRQSQDRVMQGAIAAREGLPTDVDWRMMGYNTRPSAVTNVKRQGTCGGCWAFAAIAAVEGINSIRTRNLTSLSVQQLLDCDKGNEGCRGGNAEGAFKYMIHNGGIETEAEYPYVGHEQGHCSVPKKNRNPVVTINGYKQVPPNEVALMQAVAAQPVVVALDANSMAFRRYGGGVFVGPCGTDLSHEMTVVGYGTTGEQGSEKHIDYWIVKNSLGPEWGENGYIRIARNVSGHDEEGLCGILIDASYPVKFTREGVNDIMKTK
ncbi:ervatamin-C-like [Hordeum vulgare subsp. vulgare]|uniref:Uncharacterized protein n=1 Tax=Hordeum vulgare subsp. vulgare TaxID=112509 RepID=A0A8I6XXP5_HORVV|nr:ervatamin-C-like [Hordeum vulgare subsp. vulgare]